MSMVHLTLDRALAHLAEDAAAAEAVVNEGLRAFPADAGLHLVQGVALRAQGRERAGWQAFWRALAAEPGHSGARAALVETLVEDAAVPPPGRDFSLDSGERQTAAALAEIRADHRARYAAAARWLRGRHAESWRLTGLDAFCGNGYGSRLVADRTGARMAGLDGSAEAVALAEAAYGDHRVVFGAACFPFRLTPGLFDFALCFESVEHVDDPFGLLRQVAAATSGPLLVSVPLESGLPFARNSDLFHHHTRHFHAAELFDLLARAGRPTIAAQWGQRAYVVENGRVRGLLPPAEMGLVPPAADSQFLMVAALP